MKNRLFMFSFLCIGLCALTNVGSAQDVDEQPTSEKQAFLIESAEVSTVVFELNAPKAADAFCVVNDAPAMVYSLVTHLEPAYLDDKRFSNLENHVLRLCDRAQPLYNQFVFIKERFTGQWYHYVFS